MLKDMINDSLRRFAKRIRNDISQLEVGYSEAILESVFFTSGKAGKFKAIAHQIAKLADVGRRHEAGGDKVMLKKISDPFGIFFVGLFTTNGFNVFGMGEDEIARRFKDIENRNPVFTGRFHTNITAVVRFQPRSQARKPLV